MLAERHRARLAMQEGETRRNLGHRVVRKLFQDPDQDPDRNNDLPCPGAVDNSTNQFLKENREDLEKAQKKWNFDFVNEKPLPGRYEWRYVGGARNSVENCGDNDWDDEEDEDDGDEEDGEGEGGVKKDQKEKSETEANEKAVGLGNKGVKD